MEMSEFAIRFAKTAWGGTKGAGLSGQKRVGREWIKNAARFHVKHLG